MGSYLSDPYVVYLPLRWIAHFRGQGRGQGGAPGLIPSQVHMAGSHGIAGEGYGSDGPAPCPQEQR